MSEATAVNLSYFRIVSFVFFFRGSSSSKDTAAAAAATPAAAAADCFLLRAPRGTERKGQRVGQRER